MPPRKKTVTKPQAEEPVAAPVEHSPMADIMDSHQRRQATEKNVAALRALRVTVANEEAFREDLTNMAFRTLILAKREPAVERAVDLIVQYVAKSGDQYEGTSEFAADDELLNFFLGALLERSGAKDKGVRFRVCMYVSKLLHALNEEAEMDEEIGESIHNMMLVRARDKIPAVRVQAINALARLQDPSDAECAIITEYLERIASDSSPDVRKAVLTQIALSKKTLPAIIERTRDSKDVVRKHAFAILQAKLSVTALTIADRMKLLEDGLNDRVEMVRDACVDMLASWHESAGNDYVKLLGFLDLEGAAKVCQSAVQALLRKCGAGATVSTKDFESLDCERAFFWRMLCQFAQETSNDSLMERIAPPLSEFADIIRTFATMEAKQENTEEEKFEAQIIAVQLLHLACHLDFSDEAGRRVLSALLRDMLVAVGTPIAFIEPIMHLNTKVFPDETDRIRVALEVLTDIREPIQIKQAAMTKAEQHQRKLQIAAVITELHQTKDKKEALVKAENYAEAELVKKRIEELEERKRQLSTVEVHEEEVREKKDDPVTWTICLTLIRHLLETTRINMKHSNVGILVNDYILQGVQNEEALVRNIAIRCLGLCCLADREFAQTHLLLFLQVAQVDQDALQITALEALFDLLMVFGVEAFLVSPQDPNTDGPSSILPVLERYLDSENSDLRTVATEGFARLFFTNRIASAQILSHLFLIYYNPTTEDEIKLRQCLTVFFPEFAFSSLAHQKVIEQTLFPTLRTVAKAPKSSPLSSIKLADMAEYIVSLMSKPDEVKVKDLGLHHTLAISIANEILSSPKSALAKALCKCLNSLQLHTMSFVDIKSLRVLVTQLQKVVQEKVALKCVDKVYEKLEALDETPGEGLSEEKLEELRAATLRHMDERGRSEGEEDEEEDEEESARTQRSARPRRAAAAKAKNLKEDDLEEEEREEEMEEDLELETQAQEKEEEAEAEESKPAKRASRSKKAAAPAEKENARKGGRASTTKAAPAKKTVKQKKKASKIESDEEDEEESLGEEEEEEAEEEENATRASKARRHQRVLKEIESILSD